MLLVIFIEQYLYSVLKIYGAGNGARTRGIKLGKLALYQLSYARLCIIIREFGK
jgi:hypothetical protein